jgi:hypothetical protein
VIIALSSRVREGNAKLRWNACYAVMTLLSTPTPSLHEAMGQASWAPGLFLALMETVRDCLNFKVRINAAIALGALPSRASYGASFSSVAKVLTEALASVDAVHDFKQFQYKAELELALSNSLLRVLSISGNSSFFSCLFYISICVIKVLCVYAFVLALRNGWVLLSWLIMNVVF